MRARPVTVFALLVLVVLPSLVFAQPDPGTIGVFLDPEGTISVDRPNGRGGGYQRPDLYETEGIYFKFTLFLLAQDLEGGALTYEFALAAAGGEPIYSLEQFTGVKSWSHWPSLGDQPWFAVRTNYRVELDGCLSLEGTVQLARIEVAIPYPSIRWSAGVQLLPATYDEPTLYPATGYLRCDDEDPFQRTELPISAAFVGIVIPDAVENTTWSNVKALYR